MNNKLFVFLVVLLSALIICAFAALCYSLVLYNNAPEVISQDNTTAVATQSTNNSEEIDTELDRDYTKAPDVASYILPSNTREISNKDLEGLSREDLNKAYNEIFARYGHDFKTESLRKYFETQTWYKPVKDKVVTPKDLTALENKNKDVILARIKEIDAEK